MKVRYRNVGRDSIKEGNVLGLVQRDESGCKASADHIGVINWQVILDAGIDLEAMNDPTGILIELFSCIFWEWNVMYSPSPKFPGE